MTVDVINEWIFYAQRPITEKMEQLLEYIRKQGHTVNLKPDGYFEYSRKL